MRSSNAVNSVKKVVRAAVEMWDLNADWFLPRWLSTDSWCIGDTSWPWAAGVRRKPMLTLTTMRILCSVASIAMHGVARAYFALWKTESGNHWICFYSIHLFCFAPKINSPVFISSVHSPPLRRMRLTELTDGMVFGSHIRCDSNWSRISQANIPGFSCLKRRIFFTTVGVATCCLWNEHERKKKHDVSEGGNGILLRLSGITFEVDAHVLRVRFILTCECRTSPALSRMFYTFSWLFFFGFVVQLHEKHRKNMHEHWTRMICIRNELNHVLLLLDDERTRIYHDRAISQ